MSDRVIVEHPLDRSSALGERKRKAGPVRRYIVFVMPHDYPEGGMGDFWTDSNDKGNAISAAREALQKDSFLDDAEVWDTHTMQSVWSGSATA